MHLTRLLRRVIHRTTTGIRLRRPLITSNRHVRLLCAPTARATANLRVTGSRPSVLPAATTSTRRPIIASSSERVAHSGRTSRPMVLATTSHATPNLRATGPRPTVHPATTASPRRPIIAPSRERVVRSRFTASGGPTVLRPTTTTTRATPNLSASRGPSRPIIPSGYIRRPTMPQPTTVRPVHIRPPAGPSAAVVASVTLRPTPAASRPTTPLTSTRRLNSMPSERPRPLGSRNPRLTLVYRSTKVMVGKRSMLLITLHGSELNMALMSSRQLPRARPRPQPTVTTVVAHPSHIDVVHNRLVVNIGDMNPTEIGHRPVVIERTPAPVATLKPNTTVPVPVIDTTVEAYVRAPVARVPDVHAFTPSPVARGPQQTRGGRDHPGARHPVVVIVAIGPIARRPDIPNRRTRRLFVHRQSRRRYSDRNANGNKREGRHRKCRQREPRNSGPDRIEATRFVVHDDLVALSERRLNTAAESIDFKSKSTLLLCNVN